MFLFCNRIPEVNLTKSPMPPQYANTSSYNGSAKEPAQKGRAGRAKRTYTDNYDADYTTGGESCDELEEDWDRYGQFHKTWALVPC